MELEIEELQVDDLRRMAKTLIDAVKCAVCLNVLMSNTIICVNGHVICWNCKQDEIETCPTCRGPYSNVKRATFVQQVLEALPPRKCRHEGCNSDTGSEADHEVFCGFRKTYCKVENCTWNGPILQLYDHARDDHADYEGSSEGHLIRFDKSEDSDSCDDEGNQSFFNVQGHFVWLDLVHDEYKEVIKQIFTFIPIGKPLNNIYVENTLIAKEAIKRGSLTGVFTTKMILNTDPTANPVKENCLYIQTPLLERFSAEHYVQTITFT